MITHDEISGVNVPEKVFGSHVYHATILEHWESIKREIVINRPGAKIHLDFGKGFYTTTNYRQAFERALFMQKRNRDRKKGTLSKNHRGIIITFDLNANMLYNISYDEYKVFPDTNEEWAQFIVDNRVEKEIPFIHGYRWTYGPMADGNTMFLCEKFAQGDIQYKELLNGYHDVQEDESYNGIMPLSPDYDQLCFHDGLVNEALSNPQLKVLHQNEDLFSRRR